jgi:hypothetical protein
MRTDMHKIVIERERRGSRNKSRKWGKRLSYAQDSDYEEEVTFISSARRRQYGWDHKGLSDVLRPLRGYLQKNLGRPWDKIYSELRQGLDIRKVTGMHLFDHVKWMVTTNCYVDERKIIRQFVKDYEVTGFYVHPTTGLLSYVPRVSRRQRKKRRLLASAKDEVRVDEKNSYRLLNGQWFWVRHQFFRLGPQGQPRDVWDAALRCYVTLRYGESRVAVEKRQCSHQEIEAIRQCIAAWEKQIRKM